MKEIERTKLPWDEARFHDDEYIGIMVETDDNPLDDGTGRQLAIYFEGQRSDAVFLDEVEMLALIKIMLAALEEGG